MYNDENRSKSANGDMEEEKPPIVTEDVCNALKSMRDGKACGVDGISTACLESLNDVEVLTDLRNMIY